MTVKLLNSPLYSCHAVLTFSTTAPIGPLWHHSITFFTISSSPYNTASTVPSGLFLTQPWTPFLSAVSFVSALKKTHCTIPSMIRCALTFFIYPKISTSFSKQQVLDISRTFLGHSIDRQY